MATTPLIERKTILQYAPARARWATVRIETENATYVGRVYIPETKKRVSDILSDDRVFVSLTEVAVNDTAEVEPFVAINKQYIRTVRILHEGEHETVARPS